MNASLGAREVGGPRPDGRGRGVGSDSSGGGPGTGAVNKALLWGLTGAMLSGCTFNGLHDVRLPGGAAADGAYRVTVEFRDVLDLVPQSTVKVNNVTVGAVEKIQLDGWHARVRLRISDSVQLPRNSVAAIAQTSILGEKYVALARPTEVKPQGRLRDGAVIPLSRSGSNPEIEEVLSALSALLNGGGVAQLKTITQELNHTLEGREERIKSLLRELDTFIGGLDRQRGEIVRALKGMEKLSARLKRERRTVGTAVETIPPALKVLADQRRKLTTMLTSMSKLGRTGTEVVRASHRDTVANLRHVAPILRQLNRAGSDLPNSLELLTTYPFPRNAANAIKGDYVNMKITADLDLDSVYGNLTDGEKPRRPGKPDPDLPDVPEVPDVPGVPELPDVPEAPDLPGTPDAPAEPELPGLTSPEGDQDGGDRDGDGNDGGGACLPLCTGSNAAYGSGYERSGDADNDDRYRDEAGASTAGLSAAGVSAELAELMTRGMYQ